MCASGLVCRAGLCQAPLDGGTCTATISQGVVTSARHVPPGTSIEWGSNPPAGGDHYAQWLRWAKRYEQVPRGNYVHNEEHGGVVLINPCETGCDALSDELEAMGRALDQDPICRSPINARWIVVRDPLVPPGTAVAAVAWGWVFRAPCFDRGKLEAFILEHIGRGPEDTCTEGSAP